MLLLKFWLLNCLPYRSFPCHQNLTSWWTFHLGSGTGTRSVYAHVATPYPSKYVKNLHCSKGVHLQPVTSLYRLLRILQQVISRPFYSNLPPSSVFWYILWHWHMHIISSYTGLSAPTLLWKLIARWRSISVVITSELEYFLQKPGLRILGTWLRGGC